MTGGSPSARGSLSARGSFPFECSRSLESIAGSVDGSTPSRPSGRSFEVPISPPTRGCRSAPGNVSPQHREHEDPSPQLSGLDPCLDDPRLDDPRPDDPGSDDLRLADLRLADLRLADLRLAGGYVSGRHLGPFPVSFFFVGGGSRPEGYCLEGHLDGT